MATPKAHIRTQPVSTERGTRSVAQQVAQNLESFLDSQFYWEWRKGRALRNPARHLRYLQNLQTKSDIFDDLTQALNDAFAAKELPQFAADQMLHYVQAMTLVAQRDGTLSQVFPVPGEPGDRPATAEDLE